jgi:hypothetical protein
MEPRTQPRNPKGAFVNERTRQLLITLRAALIMALNAIDDCLGMPRTIPCRAERRGLRNAQNVLD